MPRYRDCRMALLTRHHKATSIQPSLARLGIEVQTTDGFDTDLLGTFTGETPRILPPVECARRKAEIACELTGLEIGLGSEGSFGGGPAPGLLNWDIELLVMVDRSTGLEIVASAQGPLATGCLQADEIQHLHEKLSRYDASQRWVLRHANGIEKGIDAGRLPAILSRLGMVNRNGRLAPDIVIEPDLRAMHCPERKVYISKAAEQLCSRLGSLCPACGAPDFWINESERGLPCSWCSAPTQLPLAFIRLCRSCGHRILEESERSTADPGRCDYSNP
jgi:hypothetical protein